MMELKLLDQKGQSTASVAAPDALFGRDYNEALVHQVVTAYLANARRATRAQKDRGTVKHSTKKPWRQKGTGRARAGMTSSPLWRGGGRIFPNTAAENYSHKLNRKMYRAGVCSILSQLAREGRLAVVDSFTVDTPKTKLLAQKVVVALGSGNTRFGLSRMRSFPCVMARMPPSNSMACATAESMSPFRILTMLTTGLAAWGVAETRGVIAPAASAASTSLRVGCVDRMQTCSFYSGCCTLLCPLSTPCCFATNSPSSVALPANPMLFTLPIARHAGHTLSPRWLAFDHTGLASRRNRTPTRPLGFTLLRSLRSNHAGGTKTAIRAFVTPRLGASAIQSAGPSATT